MRKVVQVDPLPDYRLRVRFDNGFEGIVDLSNDLWGEMAAPLKDVAFFSQVFIEYGAVTWPNEYDMCPDALYHRLSGEPLPFVTPVAVNQ